MYKKTVIMCIIFSVLVFAETKLKPQTYNYKDIIRNSNVINNIEYNQYENIDYTPNPLEEYIMGVVAAEMPVSFETEALKAQAVASRTYTLRHSDGKNINPSSIEQAYITVDEMKKRWGNSFDNYYNKIRTAVYGTKGIIMLYDNEPIEAVFHSTSSGMTEDSQNIWGQALPYIKSTSSAVDENAPNFISKKEFTISEFNNIIKAYFDIDANGDISVISVNSSGYVNEVSISGKNIKATKLRTALGLRSTCFTIEKNSSKIIFTTKGYGHGGGMSQYGAEFMAKDGSTFDEILNHYYTNIIICSMEKKE